VACFKAVADGMVLTVRLTPRGGRDAIDGAVQLSDGREVLAVRVRAAPADGAANAGLVALIAKKAGVARSAVSIAAGTTSRVKQVKIVGDAKALTAVIEKLARPTD